MKLTALAVVILALGVVLGFALRDTVFEAEAAEPPPTGRLIELGTMTLAPASEVLYPLTDVGRKE